MTAADDDRAPAPDPDAPAAAGEPPVDDVVELDSRGLRAMAHPLRSRLLGALRMDGPATATALAQRLGTNSGATSYHLRQLADAGLVEEADELGDGRSRYWRSVHRSTRFSDLRFQHDPDDRAAAEWLMRSAVRHRTRWTEDWLDVRDQWPQSWRSVADLSDFRLELTPEQLEAMVTEVHELVERYRTLNPPGAPGTEQVLVLHSAFPMPDPSL